MSSQSHSHSPCCLFIYIYICFPHFPLFIIYIPHSLYLFSPAAPKPPNTRTQYPLLPKKKKKGYQTPFSSLKLSVPSFPIKTLSHNTTHSSTRNPFSIWFQQHTHTHIYIYIACLHVSHELTHVQLYAYTQSQ